MRWLILSIAMLFSAASAAEGLTLKGFTLGASEENLHEAYPTIDCYSMKIAVYRRCEVSDLDRPPPGLDELLDVGGELSELTTLIYFDDKLSSVDFYMSSGSFNRIITMLRTKYGPPSSQLGVPVQNRMGAKYINDIVRWQRGGRIIEVERYHQRLDHMLLTLKTVDHDAQMARRERDHARRAAAKL